MVGAEELTCSGYGEWQLAYTVAGANGTVRKVSGIWKTQIEKSLPFSDTTPEQCENWFAALLDAASAARETLPTGYRTASDQDEIDEGLKAEIDLTKGMIDNINVYDLKLVQETMEVEKLHVADQTWEYAGAAWGGDYVDVPVLETHSGKVTIIVGEYENTPGGGITVYDASKINVFGTIRAAGTYYFTVSNGLTLRFSPYNGSVQTPQSCYAKGITVYTTDIREADTQGLPDSFLGTDRIKTDLDGVRYAATGLTSLSPQITKNAYVNYEWGQFKTYSDATYARTDYIAIPNTLIKIEHNFRITFGGAGWAFYDAGKQYISGGQELTITDIPSNAAYIALSNYDTSGTHANLYVKLYCGEAYRLASESALKNTWYGKKALCIGDSLTYANIWPKELTNVLGMDVSIHGYGGRTTIELVDGDNDDRSPKVLDPLTSDDVAGKDLIIFFGGYNDRGTPDGEAGDLYPTQDTMRGRIQYCINRIYELLEDADNLTCKIVFLTPHCAGKYEWNNVDGYGEYPAGSGRTMRTMAEAIENTCADNSIPCLNLWETSGINRNTWSVFSASPTPTNQTGGGSVPFPYNNDQLHLNNDVGYPYLGKLISKWIDTM